VWQLGAGTKVQASFCAIASQWATATVQPAIMAIFIFIFGTNETEFHCKRKKENPLWQSENYEKALTLKIGNNLISGASAMYR